jgi:hypothetical protein
MATVQKLGAKYTAFCRRRRVLFLPAGVFSQTKTANTLENKKKIPAAL